MATVPGRGYRFIAEVDVSAEPLDSPAARDPRMAATPPAANGQSVPSESAAAPVPVSRVHALARPLGLGLAAVAFLAGLMLWTGWRERNLSAADVRLAVLPFENLGGVSGHDYLAEGLAEDTIAALGQIDPEHLRVVARTSTLAYRRTTMSASDIGRELGADYVVDGSLRTESGRLRVTAKLIRTADQVQVWSASYDREPTSVLGLQQELSSDVAEQIRLRLSPDRLDTIARRQTQNADAYDLYLRGRNFEHQRTPETTRRAIEYYERAIALDPGYALAWSGIAMAHAARQLNSDARPLDVWPRARDAAAKAIRAAPGLAEAQFAHAYVQWCCDWDWPAAEAGFRQAVALDPQFPMAPLTLAHALSQMGRHAEASDFLRHARELDPMNAMVHALSSQVAFQARDYPGALDHADRAIVVDPEFWIGHMMRGQALEQMGEHDRALETLTIAARFSGQNSKPVSLRGYVLAKDGRGDEARQLLTTLEAASRTKYVPPFAMALIHVGLRDDDLAVDLLERAYEDRDVHLIFLPVDPKWDPLRAHPRFEALLARCGFRAAGTGR